jgi:O-antigen ligase
LNFFDKIHLKYFGFFTYFILLYFGGRYALNGLAVFMLIMIFSFIKNGISSIKNPQLILLIPIIFYILHVLSAIFSEHKSEALFDLQVKLSFVLLPIIFALEKSEKKLGLNEILKCFSLASLIGALILIVRALFLKFSNGQLPVYSAFSPNLHVSYLAAYLTVNLIISHYLLFNFKERKWKIISSISIFLSLPTIFLAQSKAGIIIYLLFLIVFSFRFIFNINKKLSYSFVIVFLVVFIYFISVNTRFKSMFYQVKNYKELLTGSDRYVESTAERIMTWDASIKLIRNNIWLGLGNGDVRIELQKKYDQLGYSAPAKLKLNAHNQYLETTLYIGIFGFITLFTILLAPFTIYYYRNFHPFTMFLIVFGIHFLFESMLNTQSGVVFFMFFYSLFATNIKTN